MAKGSEGTFLSYVVVTAPDALAGREHGHALVEREHLRTGIAQKLKLHEGKQRGLAGTRRAENCHVPQIAFPRREPERRASVRQYPAHCRGIRREKPVRIVFKAAPGGGERQHVRKIAGIDHRTPDIGITVPRQASQPGFQRVDRFHPAPETQILDNLFHFPAAFQQLLLIFIQKNDRAGQIARAHILALL